jgi:multidrug efflux pump subunit AcrA (membrane-fusion protein)
VIITPAADLSSDWRGANVRITITEASTTSPVLVVPAAAIAHHADGTTTVAVLGADEAQHNVAVTTGAVANGEVEVTPHTDAALNSGDLVVTGR